MMIYAECQNTDIKNAAHEADSEWGTQEINSDSQGEPLDKNSSLEQARNYLVRYRWKEPLPVVARHTEQVACLLFMWYSTNHEN